MENGTWVEGEQMEFFIIDHLKKILLASNQMGRMEFLLGLQEKISNEMNEELSKRFTEEEVHKALAQMHPLKASYPDGMPPTFFQNCWNLLESLFQRQFWMQFI